jgi:hypothetical protein
MDSLEASSSRSSSRSRSRISIRINEKDEKDKGKEILMELCDIFENILSITHGEREMKANIQSDTLPSFPSNIPRKIVSDLIFTKGGPVQSKFNDRIPPFNLHQSQSIVTIINIIR